MTSIVDTLTVRVGNGEKGHLFRSSPGSNAKALTLRDGGIAYDYVLCGASGALTLVEEFQLCRTCEAVLARDRG